MAKGKRENGGGGVISPIVADQQTQANPVGKQRGEKGPIAKATQRTSKSGERPSRIDPTRKVKQEREVADKGEQDLINNLAIQLDFAHHALGKHITMLLPPFHESELNGFVTVNCNKVSVFITIP